MEAILFGIVVGGTAILTIVGIEALRAWRDRGR